MLRKISVSFAKKRPHSWGQRVKGVCSYDEEEWAYGLEIQFSYFKWKQSENKNTEINLLIYLTKNIRK